jgi:hypothetical protein
MISGPTFRGETMWFSTINTRGILSAALSLAAGFLLTASHVSAQAVAIAEVGGYVVDPAGAAVAGAQVKITEVDKQQVHQTITDTQGHYAFPNLPIGPYQLEVSSQGFKNYVQTGITLQVANDVQLNVTMQLGSITEKVEVAANAEMVETKDSSLSQVIDQQPHGGSSSQRPQSHTVDPTHRRLHYPSRRRSHGQQEYSRIERFHCDLRCR